MTKEEPNLKDQRSNVSKLLNDGEGLAGEVATCVHTLHLRPIRFSDPPLLLSVLLWVMLLVLLLYSALAFLVFTLYSVHLAAHSHGSAEGSATPPATTSCPGSFMLRIAFGGSGGSGGGGSHLSNLVQSRGNTEIRMFVDPKGTSSI
jgi:hypothetical protein